MSAVEQIETLLSIKAAIVTSCLASLGLTANSMQLNTDVIVDCYYSWYKRNVQFNMKGNLHLLICKLLLFPFKCANMAASNNTVFSINHLTGK